MSPSLVQRAGALMAVVVAIGLLPVAANATDNPYYYTGLLAFTCISVMLTLSLNLATGYGGMLTLMQTGLQLLGGYSVALCMLRLGVPWGVGLAVAVVLSVALSIAVALLSMRSTYLYFGMLTLVVNLVLVEIGQAWIPVTGGNVGLYNVLPTWQGEVLAPEIFFYVIAAFTVAAAVIQRNFVESAYGRATMAVRESDITASSMGVDPRRAKAYCFGLSGAFAGAAGGLYALQLGAINPSVGLLDSGLIFFVGLFVGGIGTLSGPVLGTVLISLVASLIRFYPAYTNLIMGLALIVVLAVMPKGIAGTFNDWRARRRKSYETDGLPAVLDPAEDDVRSILGPPIPAGDVAIEATDIKKYFGGVKALDGVSLRIETGRIHGIIGPNGSGKSTLIDCVTRFQPVTAGEVRIFGRPAPTKPHRVAALGVTRVFQIPRLVDRVSVLDNVLTGMHLRTRYSLAGAIVRSSGFLRQDRRQRGHAGQLLRLAELSHVSQLHGEALSHGQKRLLEVVRAVATGPKVLILDEPATGLTEPELAKLARLCRTLRDHGVAVVLIEHNVDFVMGLCDVLTVLDSGKVIEEGTPDLVRNSPAVRAAYLGGDVDEEMTDARR